MPIGITAHGGRSYSENIKGLSQAQAQAVLENVKTHISMPGKGSGTFVLVNRTKAGAEIELRRKSNFQLFGRGMGNTRLNDTRDFWNSTLRQAGLNDAAEALQSYLDAKPKDSQKNRVEVSFIKDLLDKHLAAAPQQALADASKVHEDLPKAPALQQASEVASKPPEEVVGQPLPEQPQPAPAVALKASKELPDAVAPDQPQQAGVLAPKAPLAQGNSFRELMADASIRSGRLLGKGSFGEVYEIQMGKSREALVFKHFLAPEVLSKNRSGAPNEAIAAYLVSKKDPDYAKRAQVAETKYFAVQVGNKHQLVDSLGLRTLLKIQPEGAVKCNGVIMSKIVGEEAFKQLNLLPPSHQKELCRQTLNSLKVLNERGFVATDHKPENIMWSLRREEAILIDTGMFHKVSKKRPETRFVTGLRGTKFYMHVRALTGAKHGSETDAYAQAITTLAVYHTAALGAMQARLVAYADTLYEEGRRGNTRDQGLTPQQFKKMVTEVRDEYKAMGRYQQSIDALDGLLSDMDQPDTAAAFAMKCMDLSNRPAEVWADRTQAQAMFAELLSHPAMN